MTAIIPKIQVYKKENPKIIDYNSIGRVCIIGAFDSHETKPVAVTDLDEAYALLGNNDEFDGCKVLPYIFRGASGVLAMNITTWTTGENPTPTKTLDLNALRSALAKVKRERFDILFVAGNLTDEFIDNIKNWCDERFLNKMPIGWIGGCVRSTKSEYEVTASKTGDFCYGLIPNQPITLNGTDLDLLTTSAYYCGLVCSTDLNASLTQKILPDVDGLVIEYPLETVDEGISGKDLVGYGYIVFTCFDRENSIFIIVNSEQPNGYDLYINRVRDYIIREFALQQFLGQRNNARSLDAIMQSVEDTKIKVVEELDLLEDVQYNVIKKNANCVEINITKLLFAGIITEIDVYITIEVE